VIERIPTVITQETTNTTLSRQVTPERLEINDKTDSTQTKPRTLTPDKLLLLPEIPSVPDKEILSVVESNRTLTSQSPDRRSKELPKLSDRKSTGFTQPPLQGSASPDRRSKELPEPPKTSEKISPTPNVQELTTPILSAEGTLALVMEAMPDVSRAVPLERIGTTPLLKINDLSDPKLLALCEVAETKGKRRMSKALPLSPGLRRAASPPTTMEVDSEPKSPYQAVINALSKISSTTTPITKAKCLIEASNQILVCVDEFYSSNDKKEPIVMGAEDKFPVLIYAIVQACVPHMWVHCMLLQDFINEWIGDHEVTYRTTELGDALQYILSLDWQIKDQSGILSPLALIENAVENQTKALEYLKIPELDKDELVQIKNAIALSVSTIFRKLGTRFENPHQDFIIKKRHEEIIKRSPVCFDFYSALFGNKEVGLKVEKQESGDLILKFVMKHPLHVYSRLSEVVIQSFYI